MRRNTKGKRISSLPLVNRNGWNVEYQVWDSLRKKQTTKRKKIKLKSNNNQKQLYFSSHFLSLFLLPPFDQPIFFYSFPSCIRALTLFRYHLCLLSLSLFLSPPFPLFGQRCSLSSSLPSWVTSALWSSDLITTVPCTLPHSPPQ